MVNQIRIRRTKAQFAQWKLDIFKETLSLLNTYGIMTERQIYYKLISKSLGISGKSFTNQLSKFLCEFRRNGILNPSLISDTSRKIIYLEPYSDSKTFSQAFNLMIIASIDEMFTLDTWENQKEIPILVLEKFALEEIFSEVTTKFNVPLIVNRGFSSDTKFHELSSKLKNPNQTLVFQTYSDYDTSGKHMHSSLLNMAKWYFKNPMKSELSALTSTQIQFYNLPMIPKFYKRSKTTLQICELDSLDKKDLQDTIKRNILSKINNPSMFTQRLNEVDTAKKKLKTLYDNAISNIPSSLP